MEEKIIAYVNDQISSNHEGERIEAQDDLLGGGILDSLGMMRLISFIEKEFGVSVPPEDMTIENFINIETITGYISSK